MNESFLATLGAGMATLFTFHGFASWQAGAAVIAGILAKESVVSTIGILYEAGDLSTEVDELAESVSALSQTGLMTSFTALSAFAFMIFSQLYTPCVTALGTIRKEAGSWKWVGFSAVYMFAVAWGVSLVVYQIGLWLGF